jgi:hypothetical protein
MRERGGREISESSVARPPLPRVWQPCSQTVAVGRRGRSWLLRHVKFGFYEQSPRAVRTVRVRSSWPAQRLSWAPSYSRSVQR